MGQSDLKQLLASLPAPRDPRLLVGHAGGEDAAVFRLGDGRLMIQTVDFFTPIVDDPFLFGRIAAANSFSDVWAMGGEPAVALAVSAFPASALPLEVLAEIFRGAADAASEAEVEIAGGHSILADVPTYGLAVTGFCSEDELWRNSGGLEGDELVLSKPVGTGILVAAYRAERTASEEKLQQATERGARFDAGDEKALVASMATLNRAAARVARSFPVHAATDVTGYGLAGHLHEMAEGAGLAAELRMQSVPLLPGARRLADAGVVPGGSRRNLEAGRGDWLTAADGLPEALSFLACDAQTNGGLLFAVPGGSGTGLVDALRAGGCPEAAVVGRFVSGRAGQVRLV